MAYQLTVIQAAKDRYQQVLRKKTKEREKLQQEAYAKNPRIAELDNILRGTTAHLVKLTLDKAGPEAFEKIKQENLAFQKERIQQILALQMNPDDLSPVAFCEACGDHGFVGKEMCNCFQEQCILSQLVELDPLLQGSKHAFDKFKLDYYSKEQWIGSPTTPRENMQKILVTCQAYAEDFENFPFENLLLIGSMGLGKTFLSAAIARAVTLQGYSVKYGTANKIFDLFNDRMFRKNAEADYAYAQAEIKAFLSCDLLIVDDLGAEFSTSVVETALYELVNSRLVSGLHTVISTNLSHEELKKRIPPQVQSRFDGEYHTCHFFGEDIRGIIKREKGKQ